MTYEAQAAALAPSRYTAKITMALQAARKDGIQAAVDWHRRQAKHMAAIMTDGTDGRVAAKDAARASTWKTHHDYCASWLAEGCRK